MPIVRLRTLFTMLLLAVCSLPLAAFAARPDLTVMSYNIMQLPTQDWDQANRRNRLPAAIRGLAETPDVLVLQEVFTNEAYARLVDLQDLYPYRTGTVGYRCSGDGWNSISGACSNAITVVRGGVVVLSRWPILEKHALVYRASRYGSWDYLSNKGAAYVRLRKGGSDYHIIGTHLQASQTMVFDPGADDRPDHAVRMAQLREMHDWIDGFGIARSEPVIIAGDLNVEYGRGDDVVEMLDTSATDLDYPASEPFRSFSARHNWLTKANAYYGGFSLDYDQTLDYVLWRHDHLAPVEPAQQRVIALKSADSWYWLWMRGWWDLPEGRVWHDGYHSELSDHYPVVATFRYDR
ncbi:sphingomyelin phosphodiesterase [Montanilutibacter psychrotolerans]|nr:sphingomyelin phosphodiesterase [Lysobacter psychrotolerans]